MLETIRDALFSVTLADMGRALIHTLPWIIVGILLNWACQKFTIWCKHHEIRKRGEGYLIDVRKDSKRSLDEPDDCSAGVRGNDEEGKDQND